MSATILPATKPQRKRPAKKSRLTSTPDGELYRRSNLLTQPRALAFCRCLAANRRYVHVEAVRSPQATGPENFFVRWQPANADAQTRLTSQLQDERARRAVEQLPEMEFFPCEDQPGWYWCIHTYPNKPESHPAGVYLTHPHDGCNCPDTAFACRRHGLTCKHVLALRLRLKEQYPTPEPIRTRQPITPERRAAIAANIAADF